MALSELDKYKIDCVSSNKKPSGRKISILRNKGIESTKTDAEIYSIINNIEIPFCETCNKNKVELLSFSEGFRKYCSKDCYAVAQSVRNKRNNKDLNKVLSERKRIENLKIHGESLKLALAKYVSDYNTMSIHEIAEMHNLPYGLLRTSLLEHFNGKIPNHKKGIILREKSRIKMADIDSLLENKEWVLEQQKLGKTTVTVASELGCSPNYVATKSRVLGVPFPNNRSVSSYELSLKDLFLQNGETVESNNRKILSGLEIDLFLPKRNLGIEINGVYWHQYDENNPTRIDKLYHKRKTDLAEDKGIRLIHIFDYELDNPRKRSIIESMLLGICQSNTRLFAKNCQIQTINSEIYKNFLNENHIKGKIPSKVRIGLFHDNNSVMVAGFSKPRFNKNCEYELIRLCSKKGITIVGGATKLFKYFVKTFNPSSVISYCDRRFFSGSVYEAMGMQKIETYAPNYVWVKNTTSGTDIVSRYQSQKHKISDNKTKDLTEDEIMRRNKYMKVYDSGQAVFVWEAQPRSIK